MLDLNEVKNYIRVDCSEDDREISNLIEQAQIYIDSCVGEGYKKNPAKVKLANLLIKKIVSDLYENRGMILEKKGGYDKISNTILDSLANCGDLYDE